MFTLFIFFHLLLYFLSFISISKAVLINVTVDDSLPDPLTGQLFTYLPSTSWSAGVVCSNCTAAADGQKMFDRTWHDGTYFPDNSNLPPTGPLNITFKFNGSAIYVFCALALSTDSPTGYSNMTFYIDGKLVGKFEKTPPGTQGFDYNVTVYSNTSIPFGEHEFMLQNGQFGNAGNKSLTLFDYLVYSYDDGKPSTTASTSAPISSSSSSTSTTSSASSRSVGPIVGGVVGGIVGLVMIAMTIWLLLRRRKSDFTNHKKSSSFSLDSVVPAEPYRLIPGSPPQQYMSDINSHGAPASSASGYAATNGTSSRVILGHSAGTEKRPRLQQNDTSLSTSSAVDGLNPVTSSAPRRELDAGPAIVEGENDDEETLPPEYAQVFSVQSSSHMVSEDVPDSERRNVSEKGRPYETIGLPL